MDLIIQKLQDQILRFIDSVACTVDTKIVVIRLAPLSSAVKIVIPSVLAVHLLQETDCLLHIHLPYIHNMLHTDSKRSCDKQTDMSMDGKGDQ